MSNSEQLPNGEQPEFKPAVNAAELIAAGDLITGDQRRQVEVDRQAREARRQELLDRGYTKAEAGSIINSGYVMSEIHQAEAPSQAYLDDAARTANSEFSDDQDQAKAA